MPRQFVAYFHFVGWDCISLGLHVCVGLPNIELHVPFGFIRIGFVERFNDEPINYHDVAWRAFGLTERYNNAAVERQQTAA